MSAVAAVVDTNVEKPVSRRSRGKRTPGSRRRSGRGKSSGEKTEGSAEAAAPREKKERPESVPVPASFIGENKVGVVSAVIRKGRVKFGFINICPGPEIDETSPRIYFSFAQLADETTPVRRGYIVSFKVCADETQRAFADCVTLTEEGKQIAAAKEADIAQRRSERPAEESEKPKRAPRERKAVEDKLVALVVTCEGKNESKTITFNFAQSVGKLKNIATTAFEAPVEYNVFQITAANPAGEFLTKAILVTMQEGDAIHLAAPKEVVA